jgi:DNA-binding GntR family transcriptional regulator
MRSSLRAPVSSAEGRGAPARPARRPELPSGYRVEEAYRHLKTRIMSADLPPGASLNELEIAAALGTSRTPVREAIRKLEQEGLAMRYPNRGAIVTKLSMTDVLEIWQLREILEPAACALAADRIDRDALARIESAFLELRGQEMGPEAYEAFLRADVGLHGLIVDSTGNATLRSVVGMLNERIVQVRVVTSPTRFQTAVAEHLAIVAALKARDAQEAMAAMRRHLERARQSLVLLA